MEKMHASLAPNDSRERNRLASEPMQNLYAQALHAAWDLLNICSENILAVAKRRV